MTGISIQSADLKAVYGDAEEVNIHEEFVNAIASLAKESALPAAERDWQRLPGAEDQTSFSRVPHKQLQALPVKWTLEPSSAKRFKSLQAWTGTVMDCANGEIFVRLKDDTLKNAPETQTSIRLEEVDPEDFELVVPGAIFYWNVGYNEASSGRQRSSVIRFRRIPKWSKYEEQGALELRDELLDLFRDANGNGSGESARPEASQ